MGSSGGEIEFEEQLKEAGNLLLKPPSDIQELCGLLDKMEGLLANVEQAPSKSVQSALLPAMKALIADEVLRHSDTAVRMAVASCMSEITRITAPDAPYNDEEMREIFQLTVAAFEKLSDMNGNSYSKAENILDIVAKVRTCLVMLDLECDDLIIEMFKIFLKVIKSDHPDAIYSAMERTMTLVIDESEEISWDLLSTLLDSVRKEKQDSSSTSWKLAEEVITNSAVKLKPYLMGEVESRRVILSEYADVVTNIYKSGLRTLQHNHLNGTGEPVVTKELDSTSPKEVCHDVDGVYESGMKKGVAPTRNEDSVINDKSSKVIEQCSLSEHPKASEEGEQPESTAEREPLKSTDEREHPKSTDEQENPRSTDARECAGPDIVRTVESGIEQESVPKKRGRKPNSLMNPEEGYDHSWICSGRKTPAVPNRRKFHDKGVDQTPSGNSDSKKSGLLLKLKVGGEPASSASRKSSLPEASDSKKGRVKRKRSMMNQDADPNSPSASHEKRLNAQVEEKAPQSANIGSRKEAEDGGSSKVRRRKRSAAKYAGINLKKDPEERSDSETKQRRSSTDDEVSVAANEEATPSGRKVTEKDDEVLGDLKLKSKQKLDTKARGRSVNDDRSSNQKNFKKVSLVPATSDKGIAKASGDKKKRISKSAANSEETPKREIKRKRSSGKDMKITSKVAAGSSNRDGSSSEETPKTEIKRKKTAEKGVASVTPEVDEHLVRSRVKIWWPLDKMFYEGVVNSYDNIRKKHKIVYADGDVEILNLKRQRWELICSGEEEQEKVLKPDTSSDTPKKETEDTKVKPATEVKRKSSLRRKSSARRSRVKGRKSVGNSADGATLDKPIVVDESTNNFSAKDGKSQEDDENSIEDRMDNETQKTDIDSQQTTKETVTKQKGKRRKVRSGESGGEGLGSVAETSKEVKKEEGHSDEVETN